MKLNKEGREELRIMVEKELRSVPDGERIILDKNILDRLLFETIIYTRSSKKIVKLPVWSGDFLRKLDLSQVSFKDVSWSLLGDGKDSELGKKFFDEECWNHFLSSYSNLFGKRVNYSDTNIKVNFDQSWEIRAAKEMKEPASVEIHSCTFSNVDLSQVDVSHFSKVRASNFANTGLVIPKILEKSSSPIFSYTDLTGIQLGNFMINLVDILTTGGPVIGVGCTLANTRLSIYLDAKSLKENKTLQQNFKIILMAGDLNGCYINGKRVLSHEEKAERCAQKLAEYNEYKDSQFEIVRSAIQKQIGKRK